MDYEVVNKFLCTVNEQGDKVKMVTIRDDRSACTMSEDEWRKVYGNQHRERWIQT